jgi:hypothetical protein
MTPSQPATPSCPRSQAEGPLSICDKSPSHVRGLDQLSAGFLETGMRCGRGQLQARRQLLGVWVCVDGMSHSFEVHVKVSSVAILLSDPKNQPVPPDTE